MKQDEKIKQSVFEIMSKRYPETFTINGSVLSLLSRETTHYMIDLAISKAYEKMEAENEQFRYKMLVACEKDIKHEKATAISEVRELIEKDLNICKSCMKDRCCVMSIKGKRYVGWHEGQVDALENLLKKLDDKKFGVKP